MTKESHINILPQWKKIRKKIKNFLMQQELGSAALHQAMEGKRGSIDENRVRMIIRETIKKYLN